MTKALATVRYGRARVLRVSLDLPLPPDGVLRRVSDLGALGARLWDAPDDAARAALLAAALAPTDCEFRRALAAADSLPRAAQSRRRILRPAQCQGRHLRDIRSRIVLSSDPVTNMYLIQAGNHAVKCGLARDPMLRIRELQTGNPDPLALLRTYYNVPHWVERALHDYLAPYRLQGEWFEIDALPLIEAFAREAFFSYHFTKTTLKARRVTRARRAVRAPGALR